MEPYAIAPKNRRQDCPAEATIAPKDGPPSAPQPYNSAAEFGGRDRDLSGAIAHALEKYSLRP